MKYRIGFVSNSSSSSFVFVGQKLSLKQIPFYLSQQQHIIAVHKNGCCYGDNIFDITKDILLFIRSKNITIFDFFQVDEIAKYDNNEDLILFSNEHNNKKNIYV